MSAKKQVKTPAKGGNTLFNYFRKVESPVAEVTPSKENASPSGNRKREPPSPALENLNPTKKIKTTEDQITNGDTEMKNDYVNNDEVMKSDTEEEFDSKCPETDSEDSFVPSGLEESDSSESEAPVESDEIHSDNSSEPVTPDSKGNKFSAVKKKKVTKGKDSGKKRQPLSNWRKGQRVDEIKPAGKLDLDNTPEPVTPKSKINISSILQSKVNSSPRVVDDKDLSSLEDIEPISETEKLWTHLQVDFLKPAYIKDINKRPPSHPEYDSRTLHVPDDYKKTLTPGMRQWWELKSKHFDCVLFFKVGKFYELYHMDAVIGYKELGCSYMGNDFAHSGFPEKAYGKFAATLVDKGYKVARIEQTESVDQMTERVKKTFKPTKFDKVVRREICKITCLGTQTFSILDGIVNYVDNKYLLAVKQKENQYGVCFIDPTIGEFHIGQFTDDKHSSRLCTLMSHFPPTRILLERNQWHEKEAKLFLHTSVDHLSPNHEFLTASKTLTTIAENNYFEDFPKSLQDILGENNGQLNCDESIELGISCFGAIVWYLKRSLIDHHMISMGKFKKFIPVDEELALSSARNENAITSKYMVLDSIALSTLHVLENSNGTIEGTLYEKLNHCVTAFGKRLLRSQLTKPLTNIKEIKQRQDALSALLKYSEVLEKVRNNMSKLLDLERVLSNIHSFTSMAVHPDHPDSRATFYEGHTHSSKRIRIFTSALSNFEIALEIIEIIQNSECVNESELLATLCNYSNSETPGSFPNLREHLDFFKNAFDHKLARSTGKIVPQPGVDKDYDDSLKLINEIKDATKNYSEEQTKYFKCRIACEKNNKNEYVLEVPVKNAHVASDDYEMLSKNKNAHIYVTKETKEFTAKMLKAEEARSAALRNTDDRIFRKFSEEHEVWNSAVACLGFLDFLMSLGQYCLKETSSGCRAQFTEVEQSQPFIVLEDGRFPCTTGDKVYVPNDISIGHSKYNKKTNPSVLLLTGPNMGGKSTVMRQIGLTTILAQIGCHVPGEKFQLTPVDRIFTRIGGSDNIIGGESTFFTELNEAGSIMTHATKHSLALIDELGRGTSTYDGTTLAGAVLNKIIQIGCRTIFSTHYHSLVDDFGTNPQVLLEHMAYLVENEGDIKNENIIFLYKLKEGSCPKSFGFNAAKLADIPASVVARGFAKSKSIGEKSERINKFVHLISNNINDVRKALQCLKV